MSFNAGDKRSALPNSLLPCQQGGWQCIDGPLLDLIAEHAEATGQLILAALSEWFSEGQSVKGLLHSGSHRDGRLPVKADGHALVGVQHNVDPLIDVGQRQVRDMSVTCSAQRHPQDWPLPDMEAPGLAQCGWLRAARH